MTDVLRPGRASEQIARSLLELAGLLANDDSEPPPSAAFARSAAADEVAENVSDASLPERLTLTVEEAARALGISRAHAYELAARGEIPTVRLGRRVLVPRAALLRMMSA